MAPRVSDTGLITTTALIFIAVLAVVTVLGIIWGVRLQRQRSEAARLEAERVEAEGGHVADAQEAAAPLAEPDAAAATPTPAPAPPKAEPAPQPAAEEATTVEPGPLADEPVAAAAPLDASPATIADPEPAAAPAAPSFADAPLTQLKGLGPKVAARLTELGVTTIGDMAALDAGQADNIDARLGPFTGRMGRDRWIEQARFLAAGDVKGFEAVFGKL